MAQGRFSQEQLRAFVEEFERSGLSHGAFVAKKKGLASSTFSNAKKAYGTPVLPRNGAFPVLELPAGAVVAAPPLKAAKPAAAEVAALKAEVKTLRRLLAKEWGAA